MEAWCGAQAKVGVYARLGEVVYDENVVEKNLWCGATDHTKLSEIINIYYICIVL